MIIIDTELEKLEKAGKPIRVGLIGAGFMARGIAVQILNYTHGMRLVGIVNRTPSKAHAILKEAGAEDKNVLVTRDYKDLTRNDKVDVILEVTGTIDYGAEVILDALSHKKHVVSMNAELDGTVGHILRDRAKKEGVVYTLSDGDQPGVQMNLYRYIKGLGLKPVLCGNIKGLQDPYRNPTTQELFAKKWGQNPYMVTSFADGTKISFEQACVANATGMTIAKRGMHGLTVESSTPLEQAVQSYNEHELLQNNTGIVDYLVGPVPNGGVFVLATHDDPIQKHYLDLYKVGKGPLYLFYTPYHLCHFETPSSIARAMLFRDATLTPTGTKPNVEVVTVAKKTMKKGDTLDVIGGYTMYGVCENSQIARKENLLPIGLAENLRLKRDIAKDQVLTLEDVELPTESLVYRLWKEQFSLKIG